MRRLLPVLTLVLALAAGPAFAATPVRIVLIGDSTMAESSGWGPAFCKDVSADVTCINLAKGGRSSGSYKAEGSWDKALAELAKTGPWKATYVLVQFGHNDQPGKAGRSTDLATEFPVNMAGYVHDIRAAGATPVLVTPLTRRQFKAGRLNPDLAPWAEATRRVAAAEKVALLDLNADSAAAVQAMGPVASMSLAQADPPEFLIKAAETGTTAEAPKDPPPPPGKAAFDYTHLGPKGSAIFAAIVEKELTAAAPALKPYFLSPRS
ncbi:rhamnogalacturonan acetylesterase [soil metagenome]